MADITMCMGSGCRARNHCYRFTATPSDYRQSWFAQTPGSDKKCEYYYEMEVDKMYYDVIDAETGELYIDTGLSPEVIKFLIDYECRIVSCPESVPEEKRCDADIYVIPSREVM